MLVLIITNFFFNTVHILGHIYLHECFIEGNFVQNHGAKICSMIV